MPWKTALGVFIGTLLSHRPFDAAAETGPAVAFSKVNIYYEYTKAGRDGKLESSGRANDAI